MAEATVFYDAQGNAVSVSRLSAAGGFVMEPPAAQTVAPHPVAPQPVPARPDVTPAPSQRTTQGPVATTQQVQAHAEYADSAEVVGGDTYIPFGPAIDIEQQDGNDVDPGFAYVWTDVGARRTFRIAPSIGLMPLLRFAHAAKAGMDTDDLEGMAALYDMIADCVHPDDWQAFQAYATEIKAEDEELMEFVSAAMEVISARPRKRRGSSSATSPRTPARSKDSSSGRDSVIPPGAIRPAEIDGLMPVGDLVR